MTLDIKENSIDIPTWIEHSEDKESNCETYSKIYTVFGNEEKTLTFIFKLKENQGKREESFSADIEDLVKIFCCKNNVEVDDMYSLLNIIFFPTKKYREYISNKVQDETLSGKKVVEGVLELDNEEKLLFEELNKKFYVNRNIKEVLGVVANLLEIDITIIVKAIISLNINKQQYTHFIGRLKGRDRKRIIELGTGKGPNEVSAPFFRSIMVQLKSKIR